MNLERKIKNNYDRLNIKNNNISVFDTSFKCKKINKDGFDEVTKFKRVR